VDPHIERQEYREARDADGRVLLRLDGYRTVPLPDPLPDDVRTPLRTAMA